jgi:hypothetical protein
MNRDKYDDFKDEDAQFKLDEYAKSLHVEEEPLRIPCYLIPHLWGKDDICLHCSYTRKELYGDQDEVPTTICARCKEEYAIANIECPSCGLARIGREGIEAVEQSVQPTPLGDGDSAPEYGTGGWMSAR